MNPSKPNGRGVIKGRGIGKKIGEVEGRFVLDDAMKQFEQKREFEKFLSRGIDGMLRRGKL